MVLFCKLTPLQQKTFSGVKTTFHSITATQSLIKLEQQREIQRHNQGMVISVLA